MKLNQYTWDPEKDLIAEGAFAEVFKALDTNTHGRVVALKIYKEAVAKGTGGSSNQKKYSLEEEFRKIDGLSHTNIISYYGQSYIDHKDAMGRSSSYPVIVMEYAQHGTLTDFLKTKPDSAVIDKLIHEIIQGIGYLHSEGILHRDLKPGNILITSNRKGEPVAKITDFGISRDLLAEQQTLEQSITTGIGTPHYMAPEQFYKKTFGLNQQVSERTDYWALGVIVYLLLTGKRPFGHGSKDYETIRDSIVKDSPDMEKVHEQYQGLVKNCLQKYAVDRSLKLEFPTPATERLVKPGNTPDEPTRLNPVQDEPQVGEREEKTILSADSVKDQVIESPIDDLMDSRPSEKRFTIFQKIILSIVVLAQIILSGFMIYHNVEERGHFPFMSFLYSLACIVILVSVFSKKRLSLHLEYFSLALLTYYPFSLIFIFYGIQAKEGESLFILDSIIAAMCFGTMIFFFIKRFGVRLEGLNPFSWVVLVILMGAFVTSWVLPATTVDISADVLNGLMFDNAAIDIIILPNALFFYTLMVLLSKNSSTSISWVNMSWAVLGIIFMIITWHVVTQVYATGWVKNMYEYLGWYKFQGGNPHGLGSGFYLWFITLLSALILLFALSIKKKTGVQKTIAKGY